jgi:hypothetical protein
MNTKLTPQSKQQAGRQRIEPGSDHRVADFFYSRGEIRLSPRENTVAGGLVVHLAV